jgi:hypothetical protein
MTDPLEDLIGSALAVQAREKAQARERKLNADTREKVRKHNQGVHAILDNVDKDLEAFIAEALEKREWINEANVVLLRHQHCLACEEETTWCEGWFTRQRHRTDSHAHRLVKGRTVDAALPSRTETHEAVPTEICANCAESQIMIEATFGKDTEC